MSGGREKVRRERKRRMVGESRGKKNTIAGEKGRTWRGEVEGGDKKGRGK